MSRDAANEVLNALGRDLRLGQGLPVIAVNPLSPTWAAKCWVPPSLRPEVMKGVPAGDIPELSDSNDVYVGISCFGPWTDSVKQGLAIVKAPIYGNFMRRTKTNFVGMVAVMVDDVSDEDGTMGPGAKVDVHRIGLAPSWMVCTSPSCWQYWYLLDEMVTNRELAERFIDDLIKAGLTTDGKDPGMKGVSRVGRLPMGVNSKPKYGATPPEVFGQKFTGERFSLKQLANELVVDPKSGKRLPLPDPYRELEFKSFDNRYTSVDEVPKSFRVMEQFLDYKKLIRHDGGEGVLEITCPWVHQHSYKGAERDVTGTKYFRPAKENGFKGGFFCWHGYCQSKNIMDLVRWAEETAVREMSESFNQELRDKKDM